MQPGRDKDPRCCDIFEKFVEFVYDISDRPVLSGPPNWLLTAYEGLAHFH